jgi:hypothetical protein
MKGKAPTTAMLRNIPNRYTQSSLLEEINSAGFVDTYDFFYLPMDVRTRANVGYVFINFLDPSDLVRFTTDLTDYVFKKHPSMKIAKVSPAHIQGLRENLCHLANRAVTWSWHSQYRPIVKMHGKIMDLAELFTEFPELQAAAEGCMASGPPAKTTGQGADAGQTFNPAAREFVPLRGQEVCSAMAMNPAAEEFVPQARRQTVDPPAPFSSTAKEQGARPMLPPGLEGPPGLELEVEVPGPPGLEVEVPPPELRAKGFKLAKLGLEEAVSKWLREKEEHRLSEKTSAGDASSTRSSSNSTSRSRGVACS